MKSYVAAIAVIAVIVLAGLGAGIAWSYPRPRRRPSRSRSGYRPMNRPGSSLSPTTRAFRPERPQCHHRNYPRPCDPPTDANKRRTWRIRRSTPVVEDVGDQDIRIRLGCIDSTRRRISSAGRIAGIGTVADLRERRSAFRGGPSEFYLGRFLDLNGMSLGNVTLVNVRHPSSSMPSPTAASMRRRLEHAYRYRLGSGWEAPSSSGRLRAASRDIPCDDRGTTGSPAIRKTIERVLKSLGQAEEYASRPSGRGEGTRAETAELHGC